MVVKRTWKVVSGSLAAGAILVPATAMAGNGIPALHDVVPYVSESPTSEEASYYTQITEGLLISLDLESLLTAASEASDLSETSLESEGSEPSEPSVPSEESAASEASEPSAPSEPSVPSEPSEPSADDSE